MNNLSRRAFIQRSGLGALAVATVPALQHSTRKITGLYPERKLNVALCGLGRYSGILASGLESSKYCRLAGIITGTPAKAVDWSNKYNIPAGNIYNYQNFDQLKTNKDIDLVYVVLPNAMHKEYTIRAARAGKHVIVEKPMAITAMECQEMIDACKTAGVQLALGYRLHFEPFHIELKRLGQEKVFGQVRLVEASLGYKSGTPGEWRLKKALSGGGPLMNLGVYCVQVCRYILGEEPVAVTAQFGPVTNKDLFSEVEESITWQLLFPGGAVGTSTSSYNCHVDRVFASADEGFFELSPAISYGPFVGRTSKGELNFPTINQQAAQLDGIGQFVLENKPLPVHINGEEGKKDMKVLDAIYEAARTGKKISLL